MKLGVNLPQTTTFDLAHDVTAFAREAERIGFDSLWAYDRVLTPDDQSGPHGLYGMPDVPWPERYGYTTDPLVTLSMAAAVTERAELGTGVIVAPLHLPVRLAKMLSALDAASGGRLIAGLGAGWSVDEFEATAPRPLRERGAALDEFLDIAAAVWGPDPVSFDNGRYRVTSARINPKPARRIPVFLGGGRGEAALRRIARRADGWLPTAVPPQQVGETLRHLRTLAAEAGRDPDAIACVFQVGVATAPSVPKIVEEIEALAKAGVDHVYVTLPSAVSSLAELIDTAGALMTAAEDAGLH
ncbi:LLM class F420-dependent oxidoreductase [Paractinoplanes deccanensis]|uniref:LLM class F420-dependent oxidoreductase n=1 Tax=Paractinoplanes deccanensis TaxID=113561 RepID=A0ABQ3YBR1_9ACTN|nr:TIGR03619 family F420-dependent LLM class oxidoreductase [Actinoplanes deccanensis]GID77412.1 LLM class F420-dependent oxidoreductase [Actinoplanes deccanensis]